MENTIILDYLGQLEEPTKIRIGRSFGVLSNLLRYKCLKGEGEHIQKKQYEVKIRYMLPLSIMKHKTLMMIQHSERTVALQPASECPVL